MERADLLAMGGIGIIVKEKTLAIWGPVAVALIDLLWAADALNTERIGHAVSNVQMVNLVVWIFLHLPAALLASLPFPEPPADAPLHAIQILAMAFLGAVQMAGLAWLILRCALFSTRKAGRPPAG